MIVGYDPAVKKVNRIEVSDVRRRSMVDREFQHLVEIAVV
jgi:hypothetical protein